MCDDHNNAKDGLWLSCESKRCTGIIGIMQSEPEKTFQSKSTVAIAFDRTKLYKKEKEYHSSKDEISSKLGNMHQDLYLSLHGKKLSPSQLILKSEAMHDNKRIYCNSRIVV